MAQRNLGIGLYRWLCEKKEDQRILGDLFRQLAEREVVSAAGEQKEGENSGKSDSVDID